MKNKFLSSIILSLSISTHGYAGDTETISFPCPNLPKYEISLKGHFNKPGFVSPNEPLFSASLISTKTGSYNNYTYQFTGRTGEKTFEMQSQFSSSVSRRKEDNKLLMYLDTNLYAMDLVPYKSLKGTNCGESDKIFLKMIKLQGSQLEYQIILPDCLRPN